MSHLFLVYSLLNKIPQWTTFASFSMYRVTAGLWWPYLFKISGILYLLVNIVFPPKTHPFPQVIYVGYSLFFWLPWVSNLQAFYIFLFDIKYKCAFPIFSKTSSLLPCSVHVIFPYFMPRLLCIMLTYITFLFLCHYE